MRSWWKNWVEPDSRNDLHQRTAEDPAECAPELRIETLDPSEPQSDEMSVSASDFRLEPLEPRLLLSADPISAELARVIQEDAEAENSHAVAAIIQDIDAIAESNAIGQPGDMLKFSWPESWSSASDEHEHRGIDLRVILTELIGYAHEALQAGTDLNDLEIGIDADSHNPQQALKLAATPAPDDSGGGSGGADQIINEAVVSEVLDEVIQHASDLSDLGLPSDLNIEVTDLQDGLVAVLRGDTLYVDADAGGYGWFVDPVLLARLQTDAGIRPVGDPETAIGHPGPGVETLIDGSGTREATVQKTVSRITSETDTYSVMPDSGEPATTIERASNLAEDRQAQSVQSIPPVPLASAGKLASAGNDTDAVTRDGSPAQGPELQNSSQQNSAELDGDDDAGLVLGYVATTLRAAESTRSGRSGNNQSNGRNGKNSNGDTASVWPDNDSYISTSEDKGNQADARAPPLNQLVTGQFGK